MSKNSKVILDSKNAGTGIQWLMLAGTKPSLPFEKFGTSKELFRTVTRRFTLMDQFHAGVQQAFDRFFNSVGQRHVEAFPLSLSAFPDRTIYIAAAKRQRSEAVSRVARIVHANSEVQHLLNVEDLASVWRRATTPEESIVGGFDMKGQFMFLLGRGPLEEAKALFGLPENPGRLKSRPDRDPAFLSNGPIGMAVIRYPQQIEKARQHLQYFIRAGNGDVRFGYAFVSHDMARKHPEQMQSLKDGGITFIYRGDSEMHMARGFLTEARYIMRDLMFYKSPHDKKMYMDGLMRHAQNDSSISWQPQPYLPKLV